MVAPGVPDFYQGTGVVGFEPGRSRQSAAGRFRACAQQLAARAAAAVARPMRWRDWDSGLPKLWMTARVLAIAPRNVRTISPIRASISRWWRRAPILGSLLAFRRGENLIAVVPRFTLTLGGEWGDTRLPLPGGTWRQLLHGRHRAAGGYARRVVRHVPGGLAEPGRDMNFTVWAPAREIGRVGHACKADRAAACRRTGRGRRKGRD